MAHSIRIERREPQGRQYVNTSGGSILDGIDAYAPPWETAAATTALEMAIVPTGTSITVNPAGTDDVTVTNGTTTRRVCIGGQSMAGAYVFRAFARRKSGSTGAIVAQVVTFTINSVEVGRFTVAAADASVDPISGSIELVSPTLDTRFNLATYNLIIGVTASDADIEIVFTIVGA